MKVLRSLLLIPAILGSALLMSCGGSDSESSSPAWCTDATTPVAESGTLGTAADSYKIYRINVNGTGRLNFALSGLSTDCGFDLYDWDASIVSQETLFTDDDRFYNATCDNYTDATNETGYIDVYSKGYCYVIVFNNSETASTSFNLSIAFSASSSAVKVEEITAAEAMKAEKFVSTK